MDESMQAALMRSMFRFRRMGMLFPPDSNLHMSELMTLVHLSKPEVMGGDDARMHHLQHRLHVSRPAVSQMLNSLEKKGYLVREIDRNDRRKIIITLTPSGQSVMQRVWEFADGVMNEVITRVGEQDMRDMLALMERFHTAFETVQQEHLAAFEKGEE